MRTFAGLLTPIVILLALIVGAYIFMNRTGLVFVDTKFGSVTVLTSPLAKELIDKVFGQHDQRFE